MVNDSAYAFLRFKTKFRSSPRGLSYIKPEIYTPCPFQSMPESIASSNHFVHQCDLARWTPHWTIRKLFSNLTQVEWSGKDHLSTGPPLIDVAVSGQLCWHSRRRQRVSSTQRTYPFPSLWSI